MPEQQRNVKGYRALFIITLVFVVSVLGFTGYLGVSAAVEGRSAASKFFDVNIDIFMIGGNYISEADTLSKVEKRRSANEKYHIPTIYSFLFNCSVETYGGLETAVFSPYGEKKGTVVYFHGGSYMWQPTIFHFRYCRYLSDTLGVEVLMPVYPKAPNFTYRETVPAVASFYEEIEKNREVLAFAGDSAGGGLLLSFAQYLVDNGGTCPEHLITFSPCLDLDLDNEKIGDYTAADPMLNWADLKRKLSFYADGGGDDPYASPIYCDYSVLGRWTCFIGTEEIMLPDAEKLHTRLIAEGVEHDFIVYQNQFHTFAIFPIPEADACCNVIKTLIIG